MSDEVKVPCKCGQITMRVRTWSEHGPVWGHPDFYLWHGLAGCAPMADEEMDFAKGAPDPTGARAARQRSP
jgi:hypothetical protein